METIILNVNSRFRDKSLYPNAGDFFMDITQDIRNIIHMRLTSLEIPNISYMFSDDKNNNSFKLTVNSRTFTISLENGNYTSDSLIDALTTELDTINTATGADLAISISVITGKLTITCSQSFTINFSRTGDTMYSNINYFLGYTQDTYTGKSIEAESVINLLGTNYFFIKINNIQNIYDHYVPNAFAKVIINTSKFAVQFEDYDNFVSKDKQFRSPQNLKKLHIQIVDHYGKVMDFFNHDISFTLELGYIYDLELYKRIHNSGIPNGDDRLKYLNFR